MAVQTKPVVQTPLGLTEQNTHSDNLLAVSLLAGAILLAGCCILFFGLRRLCRWLNRRDTLDGSSEPTDRAPFR